MIAIDLGTCFTRAGLMNFNTFQPIDSSDRQTLNYVAIKSNSREIGENLRIKIGMDFKNLMFDSKIFIGSLNNVNQRYLARFPFELKIQDEKFKLQIDSGEQFFPEEITAIVLKKLKESAEKYLGKVVEGAVLSVPNSFTDSQRQATIDAVHLAGINDCLLINDSTAAALAYAFDKRVESLKNILIYDLGGYFLNLSIVRIINGNFEVISAVSHPELGGQIFDFRMAEFLAGIIKNDSGKDVMAKKKIFQTLIVECEKAKRNLSNSLESHLEISLFDEDENFKYKFGREKFESLNEDLFRETIASVKNIVRNSGFQKNEIDEVLLIGGSSRIPKIQKLLSEYFNGKKMNLTMNASETVVYGAAIQAAFLTGQKIKRNNGLKYCNKTNQNYSLKGLDYKNEELFELRIKQFQILPSNQCVVLKKSIIDLCCKLVLHENGVELFRYRLNKNWLFNTYYLSQIEISLNIDLCGLVNVCFEKVNKFGNISTNNLNKEKLYCLNDKQKEKLINNNIENEKLIKKK